MSGATAWGYHPASLAAGQEVQLSLEEAQHAAKARRLAVGMPLTLTNGGGQVARARLCRYQPKPLEVCARVDSVQTVPQPPAITLACSFPKGDRQAALLEAAAQLGAAQIQPLHCAFTPPAAQKLNPARARRVLISAIKQARRAWLPQLLPIATPQALMGQGQGIHLLADPNGSPAAEACPSPDTPLWLWVGPEGGFSAEERALLIESGARLVCLSPHILRIETAAAALLACVAQRKLEASGH